MPGPQIKFEQPYADSRQLHYALPHSLLSTELSPLSKPLYAINHINKSCILVAEATLCFA